MTDESPERVEYNHNSKSILAILQEHVPALYRKSSTGLIDFLTAWLQQPNSRRNFLFYKTPGLKSVIEAKGLKLQKGKKTIADMIDLLALSPQQQREQHQAARHGTPSDTVLSEPKDLVIKAMLEKSFLPHQKGPAPEYCSLGHRLEVPILKSWIDHANGPSSPTDDLVIEGAYTAGLEAKKGATYAKDSIDFVLTVQDPTTLQDDLETWGFEAKGRVSARTAADNERHFQFMNDPHTHIEACDVYETVANVGERFQVLQHAFVYNFNTVVLAIADSQSQLIRSSIIDFNTELKEDFGVVLNELKDISLKWAYPPPPVTSNNNGTTNRRNTRPKVLIVPDEILKIGDSVRAINGNDTLQGTANLWYTMHNNLPKPFPSFNRLIPAIYAFWNSVKGGSDTTTKLMDDCILRVPKAHMNPETVAIARLFMITFVLYHRLSQIFSANSDLDQYSSLYKYRNAASHRRTFHNSLLQCARYFKKELEKTMTHQETATTPPAATRSTRQNPNRSRPINDGVIPEPITFAPARTGKTHQRGLTRKMQRGQLPIEIEQRLNNCFGVMVKALPPHQQRCEICKKKTSWECALCKCWLCVDRKGLKEMDNSKLELYQHEDNGRTVTFRKSCYHNAHQALWKRVSESSINACDSTSITSDINNRN